MNYKQLYIEKLKDPRWQKKRLDIMDRDGWACRSCGASERTLHVHHLVYVYGNDPWDYRDDTLVTLCDECHDRETKNLKANEQLLTTLLKVSGYYSEEIETLAMAFYHSEPGVPPDRVSDVLFWLLTSKRAFSSVHKMFLDSRKSALAGE